MAKDEAALSQALVRVVEHTSTVRARAPARVRDRPGSGAASAPDRHRHRSSHDVDRACTTSGSPGSDGATRRVPAPRAAPGATGSGRRPSSDTPEQIASDQAAIDYGAGRADRAQQSLAEANLTSPINGTIVSVGITVGDTVSAIRAPT